MRATVRIGGLLAALTLAACSSIEETSELFVRPGKYEAYTCQQLAIETKNAAARERELKGLIEKAVREPTGPLISVVAYDTEYLTTFGELRQLRETAERKRCEPAGQIDGPIR
jgi:hypothetical protein